MPGVAPPAFALVDSLSSAGGRRTSLSAAVCAAASSSDAAARAAAASETRLATRLSVLSAVHFGAAAARARQPSSPTPLSARSSSCVEAGRAAATLGR
eukprot:4503465-Prymnesium_polylepis.2